MTAARSGEGESIRRRNFLSTGNDAFDCAHCGASVAALSQGGFRNHCPECLWSRHVDDVPGDRASECGGLMRPERLEGSPGAGWYLTHVCEECGFRRRSVTAENDPEQPDRWERIVELSAGRGP